MPGDPNKLYSVQKTMAWFALSAIALLISLVMMMIQDYNREWKDWQRKFVALERQKVDVALKQAEAKVDPRALETLRADQKQAWAEFDQNRGRFEALTAQRAKGEVDLVQARTRYQDLKQYYDSAKFFFEESRQKETEKTKEYEARLAQLAAELEQAKLNSEELERRDEGIKSEMGALEAKAKEIERKMNQMLREEMVLKKQLKKLEPSLAQDLLNAPMVDFIAPSLQIQQVVLEDLHDDLYFVKAQKVDRCTTCHLAIDRKGFEAAPQPFKTHPNLDLFLSGASPHPLERVGCTICHGGNGHSLSFVYTAHTPRDDAQKQEWEETYRWHELEKWEHKMLPLQHTQASCAKCHRGVMEVPQAPKLNAGRRLAQASGCFGCHTVKGFSAEQDSKSASGGPGWWKIGPDLRNIQSKVDREWIIRWLHDPKVFRASTKMPRIFHLDNTSSPEDRAKSNTAIEGIATYLLKHSDPLALKAPPVEGEPEIGKKLVEEVGCLGCHSLGDRKANDHGPELNHLASKVSRDWLFSWLKNPRQLSPDARMPSLRLSDEEAAHMASFLLQDRNETFEQIAIPTVGDKEAHEFALDMLSRKMRRSEAMDRLEGMTTEQKFEFIGREIILQQGCFGCHAIKGFETAKPIATELTKEGEKAVDRLDFGYVPLERTREAWFHQKMKNPRAFDAGRVRGYHEKLRMPYYGFTDEEATSLVTFLLSLREEDIPLEMTRRLDLNEREIEAGRLLVSKLNCQGCHSLDGVEGRIRSLYEDLGQAPPILDGEGAKVREEWLYRFLQKPETVRPWLRFRMPTFGFTHDETDALVKYFSNLDKQKVSFAPVPPPSSQETITIGRDLFTKFRCIQCHLPSSAQSLTASFLAPDLVMARERLKPAWVVDWLKDPQALQPGTMMPSFFPEGQTPFQDVLEGDTLKQIHAIKDYLMVLTPEEAANIQPPT